MDTLSVLQRHRGEMNFDAADIQKKIDDPNTPSDLKEALQKLKDDPALSHLLDTAARNSEGGNDSGDGHFAEGDLDAIGSWDVMKQYNARQAKTFESNYVSSESDGKNQQARDITDLDARRELYLYSGNLPDNVDENTLHDIVNGNLKGGKAPPQLMAAAQFYLDNPDQWKAMTVHGNKKGDILGVVADNLLMTEAESTTIDTMNNNREVFLGKNLTREGLQDILKNSGNSEEVKKAAQQLLDDPLLFGVLDNGLKGHVPRKTVHVDDGNISEKDFDAFLDRLTTKGKTAPAPPASRKPITPVEVKALAAMNAGALDDPAIKIAMGGGGILDFFKKIGKWVAKVGTIILHVVSIALSFLGKIPIIGPIFSALSVVAEAGAGLCNMVKTAFENGDMKKAAKMLGIGVAGAVLGAILPGVGAIVMKGVSKVATKIASSAVGRAVGKVVTPVVDSVKGTASKVSNAVSKTVDGVVRSAKTAGSNVVNGAKAGIVKGGQQLVAVSKNALDRLGLVTVEKDAEKIAEQAALKAQAKAATAARNAALKARVVKTYRRVKTTVLAVPERVGAAFDKAFDTVTQPIVQGLEKASAVAGRVADRTVELVSAPFIKAGRLANRIGEVLSMPFVRAGQMASSAAGKVADGTRSALSAAGEKIARTARQTSYKLGLSTPERDAEKALEKAAKRAVWQEKNQAKANAKAKKAEEKAAKKRRKEEEKDALLRQQYVGGGYFDDISMRMAIQKELQKNLKRALQASAPDTAPPPMPLPQVAVH